MGLFVCLCQGPKSKVKKVVGKNELGECVWVRAGGCGWKWAGWLRVGGNGWTCVRVGKNNLGDWVSGLGCGWVKTTWVSEGGCSWVGVGEKHPEGWRWVGMDVGVWTWGWVWEKIGRAGGNGWKQAGFGCEWAVWVEISCVDVSELAWLLRRFFRLYYGEACWNRKSR